MKNYIDKIKNTFIKTKDYLIAKIKALQTKDYIIISAYLILSIAEKQHQIFIEQFILPLWMIRKECC